MQRIGTNRKNILVITGKETDWTLNEKGFSELHRGRQVCGVFPDGTVGGHSRGTGLQRGNHLNKYTRRFYGVVFFFQLPNAAAKFTASLNTREERQEMHKTAEERQ